MNAEKQLAQRLIDGGAANMTNWRPVRLLDYLLERLNEEPLGRPTEVEKALWNELLRLERENEWIPVSEAPPKEVDQVLVWGEWRRRDLPVAEPVQAYVSRWEGGGREHVDFLPVYESVFPKEVTHWRLKPQPPEREK